MPVNVLGFQTHRDHFAIDFERDRLYKRIDEMRDEHISDQEFTEKYNITDNRDWQLFKARQRVCKDAELANKTSFNVCTVHLISVFAILMK